MVRQRYWCREFAKSWTEKHCSSRKCCKGHSKAPEGSAHRAAEFASQKGSGWCFRLFSKVWRISRLEIVCRSRRARLKRAYNYCSLRRESERAVSWCASHWKSIETGFKAGHLTRNENRMGRTAAQHHALT